MKTASRVLAIVGGAIAILVELFLIINVMAIVNQNPWAETWNEYSRRAADFGLNMGGPFIRVYGGIAALGGILGIIGGIIVKRNSVTAGVMMLIAAAAGLFAFFNFVSILLFILGAVFAFVKEKAPYTPQA